MSILAGIAAQAKAQEQQIKEIPLAAIEANAGNFYGIEEEGVAELAASILAVGQRQPIEVYPIPGGRYRIITGERRWRAMKLNQDSGQTDRDTIQAIVRECPVDEAEEVVQIVTTNQYRDKTDFDKLQEVIAVTKAVKGLKEKGVTGWHGIDLEKVTVKQAVTAITGMSRTNVSKYGTIGEKLIPELVVWVRNEMLPFTVAYSVCQLPAEWQRLLLVACNSKGNITLNDYNDVVGKMGVGLEKKAVRAVLKHCQEVARCLDPAAIPARNADKLTDWLAINGGSHYPGKVGFVYKARKITVEMIGGEEVDIGVPPFRFCCTAAEQYKDLMKGTWKQDEDAAEEERRKEEFNRKVETVLKMLTTPAEKESQCNNTQNQSGRDCPAGALPVTQSLSDVKPASSETGRTHSESVQVEQKGTDCRKCACFIYENEDCGHGFCYSKDDETGFCPHHRVDCKDCVCRECGNPDCRTAHCNGSSCDGFTEDGECPDFMKEQTRPGGWVKAVTSAGPWPDRDGLCAVKTEQRGLNGYAVFWRDNQSKQWCFPEKADGEWISVSTRVEMWCMLPEVPE